MHTRLHNPPDSTAGVPGVRTGMLKLGGMMFLASIVTHSVTGPPLDWDTGEPDLDRDTRSDMTKTLRDVSWYGMIAGSGLLFASFLTAPSE